MKQETTDILILGAGLTGLMIADLLRDSGYKIVLLEKEKCIGGLSQTIDFKGFRFDLGGHRICFHGKDAIDYLKSTLSVNVLIQHRKKSSVLLNNRFVRYPPNIFDIFSYGIPVVTGCLLSNLRHTYCNNAVRPHSLKDWVSSYLGSAIHDIYFKDYSEKIWGITTDKISASWAEKRIGKFNICEMANPLFGSRNQNKENTVLFYYPQKGVGAVCDAIFKKIKGTAKVILDANLLGIDLKGERMRSVTYKKDKSAYQLKFRYIISTIPLKPLLEYMPYLSIYKDSDLVDSIKYRSLLTVNLISKQSYITRNHWIYFPDKGVIFSRVSEPGNWDSSMVRDNKSSICCEIFCDYGDSIWSLGDEQIVRRVVDSLNKLNIVPKNKISDSLVKRIRYAYPLMYLGHEKGTDSIFSELSNIKNLITAGRSGRHSYFDMEECYLDAKRAARELFAK